MTRPMEQKGTHDSDLEELFLAFDEVRASEELKSAALMAIFAQMDEEEGRAEADAEDLEPKALGGTAPHEAEAGGPGPDEVEGLGGTAPHEAEAGGPGPDEVEALGGTAPHGTEAGGAMPSETDTPGATLRLVEADETDAEADAKRHAQSQKATPKKHDGRFVLRVAAVAIVILVGVTGALSFVMPVSHVRVSVDDVSFDLGVNVYGTTVSATASSGGGLGTLAKAKVQNVALDDAVTNLMDACKEEGVPEEVSVSVRDSIGGDNPTRAEELRDKAKKELGGTRETAAAEGAQVAQVEDEPKQQEVPAPVEPNANEQSSSVEPKGLANQGEGMPQEQVVEPAQPTDSPMQEVAQDNVGAMPRDEGRLEGDTGMQVPVDNRMSQPGANEDGSLQGGDGIQVLDQPSGQPAQPDFGQGGAEPVVEL